MYFIHLNDVFILKDILSQILSFFSFKLSLPMKMLDWEFSFTLCVLYKFFSACTRILKETYIAWLRFRFYDILVFCCCCCCDKIVVLCVLTVTFSCKFFKNCAFLQRNWPFPLDEYRINLNIRQNKKIRELFLIQFHNHHKNKQFYIHVFGSIFSPFLFLLPFLLNVFILHKQLTRCKVWNSKVSHQRLSSKQH